MICHRNRLKNDDIYLDVGHLQRDLGVPHMVEIGRYLGNLHMVGASFGGLAYRGCH